MKKLKEKRHSWVHSLRGDADFVATQRKIRELETQKAALVEQERASVARLEKFKSAKTLIEASAEDRHKAEKQQMSRSDSSLSSTNSKPSIMALSDASISTHSIETEREKLEKERERLEKERAQLERERREREAELERERVAEGLERKRSDSASAPASSGATHRRNGSFGSRSDVVPPSQMKEVASKVLSMLAAENRARSGDWSHLTEGSTDVPSPTYSSPPGERSMTDISERLRKILLKYDETASTRSSSSQQSDYASGEAKQTNRPSHNAPEERPTHRKGVTFADSELLLALERHRTMERSSGETSQAYFERKFKEHVKREMLLSEQLVKTQYRQQILRNQFEQQSSSSSSSSEISAQLTENVILEGKLQESLLREEGIKRELLAERDALGRMGHIE